MNLGVQPLYMEEPRRALIALEMISRDNYIVPTEMGGLYFKKPPLYNWVLVGMFNLFGSYSEFATRFVTVMSLLSMTALTFLVGKKYVNLRFGVFAAFFFVITADILFVFSLLGEIDVFYSLLTLLSIFSIFHFYEKRNFWLLFLGAYFFGALGALTKGIPSVAYLGVSLLAFFSYKREFKKLFSLYHICGLLLFTSIVGGYFYLYSLEADVVAYLSGMFGDASEKSTMGDFPVMKYVKHVFLFPIQTLGALFPTSFLLLFLVKSNVKNRLKESPFVFFCAVMVVSNILIYWLSPGSKQRYIYPLYPLISCVLVYFFLANKQDKKKKAFEWFGLFFIVFMAMVSFSLPIIQQYEPTGELAYIESILAYALVFGLLFLGLLALYLRYKEQRVLSFYCFFFTAEASDGCCDHSF